MRRIVLVLLAALLAVPALGGPAAAAEPPRCRTDTASVAWETDLAGPTVTAAVVEVLGCDDGAVVGLQLLTDEGELPESPLRSAVAGERARFDLSALSVRVEPVTGVRVMIFRPGTTVLGELTVQQRFYSQSGEEQLGLRRSTPLSVEVGETYVVPEAPTRYDTISCSAVSAELPADLVAEGAGQFTLTSTGTHVVCYQERPGTRGGPPDVEEPYALSGVRSLTDRPARFERATEIPGSSQGRTAGGVLLGGLLGTVFAAVLARTRRRRRRGP